MALHPGLKNILASDVSASENLAVDGRDPNRPWPPYARLRSTRPTAFTKDKPVRQIRLTLDGDMERYVWFLNNKPLSDTHNILTAEWEVGWRGVDDTEWEGIFTWDRYLNRFFTVFAGADTFGEGDEHDDTRGVLGFRYLLPLNLESRVWVDTDGGGRFNLGKSFELTPRLTLMGEAQYDAHDKWEDSLTASYVVHQYFSLVAQLHSDYSFGGGLQVRF